MYGCGTFDPPPYGGSSAGFLWGRTVSLATIVPNLRNNLIQLTTGPGGSPPPYITGSNLLDVQGTNNMFFGNGAAPGGTSLINSTVANPLFTNPSAGDFTIPSNSPAKNGGATIGSL